MRAREGGGGVAASGLWIVDGGQCRTRLAYVHTNLQDDKRTRAQEHTRAGGKRRKGKRKALRLERVAGGGGAWAAAVCRHPHEALENCECYKLPNCGRDWNEALSLLQADWT